MFTLPLPRKGLVRIVFLLMAVCILPATGFSAPQFGLGISITESGSVIYCPVILRPDIRLEGSLGLYSYDRENSIGSDTDALTLKIGGYLVQDVYDKTQIYYGGKVIYEKLDAGGSDQNGYGIAPTFGFEYYFTKQISLGGEAELSYVFYDRSGGDAKEYGTDSRVILRYYF